MAKLDKYNNFNVDDALNGFWWLRGVDKGTSTSSMGFCAGYTYFTLGFGLLGFNESTKQASIDVRRNTKGNFKYKWNWNDRPYGDAYIGVCESMAGSKWEEFCDKMDSYGYSIFCKEFRCQSAADAVGYKTNGYPNGYVPMNGDVCAMSTYKDNNGKISRDTKGHFHMCMYLEGKWYSDFQQDNMIPYSGSSAYPQMFTIWRFGNDINIISDSRGNALTMDYLISTLPDKFKNEFNLLDDKNVPKPSSYGDRVDKCIETFIKHGLTRNQAIVLTCCGMQECGCDPTKKNEREFSGKGASGTDGWRCGEGFVQFTFWKTKKNLIKKFNASGKNHAKLPESWTEYSKDSSKHIVDLDLEDALLMTEIFYNDIISRSSGYDEFDVCADFYLQKAGRGGSAVKYSNLQDKAYYRAEDYIKTHTAQNPGVHYDNSYLKIIKSMFYTMLEYGGSEYSGSYTEVDNNNKKESSDSSSAPVAEEKSYVVKKSPSTSALNSYSAVGNYSDANNGRSNRLKDFFAMGEALAHKHGGGRSIKGTVSEDCLVDTSLVKSENHLKEIQTDVNRIPTRSRIRMK